MYSFSEKNFLGFQNQQGFSILQTEKIEKEYKFFEKAKKWFTCYSWEVCLRGGLWEALKRLRFSIWYVIHERKYYFFYKRPNIKVKLNRDKSAVMQSYRYKCSQIRCRETEVLPLPLSCRIYQITNSNHQSILFSLVINHNIYNSIYIHILLWYIT